MSDDFSSNMGGPAPEGTARRNGKARERMERRKQRRAPSPSALNVDSAAPPDAPRRSQSSELTSRLDSIRARGAQVAGQIRRAIPAAKPTDILASTAAPPVHEPRSDRPSRLDSIRARGAQVAGQMRRAAPRHSAPQPRVQIPSLDDIPLLRQIVLGAAALIFMLLMIALVGMFRNRPPEALPNAIWLGEDWTYAPHTDDEVNALIVQLREHRIGIVYAWVSVLNADGTWSGPQGGSGSFSLVEDQVAAFAQQFARLYPAAELYGWIRYPAGIAPEGGTAIANQGFQTSTVNFSQRIVNSLGFDGVLLDVEAVWNGEENYLRLLQQVRGGLGDASLAASLPPDWHPAGVEVPASDLIAEGTAWDVQYKQRVALLADHLVVQAFNSYLETEADYEAWVAYQVQAYAEAIAVLESDTIVLIGVPAYDDLPPAHTREVENITAAITGVRRGLDEAGGSASVIEGLAIYAGWSITEAEWTQFERQWVGGG